MESIGVRPSYDFLTMNLHFLKGRKLLITAGVYESEVAEKVQDTFEKYRETQSYKEAILSTANTLQLSKASVTSYLPYQKGVYFPSTADKEKISVGAERQRRYRAIRKLRSEPTEEHLWETVLLYCGVQFKTYSGLPFTYEIRKGRSGEYTKELWIDRRGKSKSLAWSSVLLALGNIKKVGEVVERPKALSDIRGVTYIYGMFYRFGLIDVPKEVKEKKNDRGNKKQKKGREDMLEENIKFSNNDPKLCQKWTKIMGLKGFEKAYPSQLSGGMKARVSLARALIFPNNFMLLDEPFASLDEITKEKLEVELINYMKIKNSGFLFVSHDLEEALNVGQRLIIMKNGKIVSDFDLEDGKLSKEILRNKFKKIIGEENEK